MDSDPDFEYNALEEYLGARFNMLTLKGHTALTKLPDQIKTAAFYSAKVGKAHVLERLRAEVDAYTRGEVDPATARANLTAFLKRNGYIPGGIGDAPAGVDPSTWARRKSIRNLASAARLDLILEQNRRMAEAVGEYQRMYDPDVKEFFPCVIYHAVTDDRTRHGQYDGKIIDKDDPWLLTHTPPWEFNCRCWLEDCERPADEKKVWKITPEEEQLEKEEAKKASGYIFRPDLAFEANDLGQLSVKSRQRVVDEMTALVRNGTLPGCTLLAAPPEPGGAGTHPLAMSDFKTAMRKMEEGARKFVTAAGLDPDHMPDWDKQIEAFETHFKALEPPPTTPLTPEEKKKADRARKKKYEIIPDVIKNAFPATGVDLGTLSTAHVESLGLKQAPMVRLSTGSRKFGIVHNWKHHKEMFTDLADSQKALEETIGNPNARCVLSITVEDKRLKKLLVFYNPDTQAYCVSHLKGDDTVEIMSWHRAPAKYGNRKWNTN